MNFTIFLDNFYGWCQQFFAWFMRLNITNTFSLFGLFVGVWIISVIINSLIVRGKS